jgi:hypothetical protein
VLVKTSKNPPPVDETYFVHVPTDIFIGSVRVSCWYSINTPFIDLPQVHCLRALQEKATLTRTEPFYNPDNASMAVLN